MTVKISAPDCPICEAQDWVNGSHQVELSHHNESLTVSDLVHSECAECGYELILPHQTRRNDARIRDARRDASGLLTSARIKAIRRKLGVSQQHMAALIGCGKNSFSKYERGEVTQSAAMDKLLRILDASPEAFEILEKQQTPQASRKFIYESDAPPSSVLTEGR
ncbi:MAG: type II toxin-antitoxin system MqsA family antitoxin [Rhodospirillaceae bacterium]|nr:type II toxin-antitoxin system MqsA family antitoxin [Rhodospirillaceae bacterium]